MAWIWFENAAPGSRSTDSTKIVQRALNKELGTKLLVDGVFGPKTQAAYGRWQRKMGFTGNDANGVPGRTSLVALGKNRGFTVRYKNTAAKPAPAATGEPAHNYGRTTHGGRTVNKRTDAMIHTAEALFGGKFTLTQGSYNRGVSASAGTHDGGGVVDINVGGMSSSRRAAAVQALRKAGFAAWLRTPAQGFVYHIHACAIGDREMASIARNQVRSYFNGRNGLAGNGRDNAARPYPAWAKKYR